jgi:hypothetical protein
MPTLVDFSALIDQLCSEIDNTLHVTMPDMRAERRFLDVLKTANQEPKPEENLSKFIHFVHNIPGYEPSYFQKLLFAMGARVFSQKLMKGATPEQQVRMLRRHGLEPIAVIYSAGECGRRAGKTDGGTQMVAGALVSAPNITIIYISLHETTCKEACDSTYRWLCMAGYEKRCKKTTLAITLEGPGPTDISRVSFCNSHNPEVLLFLFLFLSPTIYSAEKN